MRSSFFIFMTAIVLSTTISCSSGGSGSSDDDYSDPGFGDVSATVTKSFSNLGTEGSDSGTDINAIIFQEKVGGTNYVGIGVNDKGSGDDDFNLKIYWSASSIPTGTFTVTNGNYSIRIVKGSNTHTTTTDDLDLTITNNGDGTYTIAFDSTISLTDSGGYTLTGGSASITAEAY